MLTWDDPAQIARALDGRASVHVITNSRALDAASARNTIAAAARAALTGVPGAKLLLRGDSTLRGHLLEEYLGVTDATGWVAAPLLLVPALPTAGRVTRAGVHLIERDGSTQPLHETEYARDGVFSYSSARILDWAQERSGGLFAAADGREVHLARLRAGGAAAIRDDLVALAELGRPAALVPDAENDDDLAIVAEGYASALAAGVNVVVRCAPTFAGVVAGSTASSLCPFPAADGPVLLVCGSYVPGSTRQLRALLEQHPGSLVEVDPLALAGAGAGSEVARSAREASARLRRDGFAVLATPRERAPEALDLETGRRVADGLALAAGGVEPAPTVVVAKGGITSAVTLRTGFGCDEADVVGPVLPGVSHWRVEGRHGLDYLVVPGNVGGDSLLADLVSGIMRR